MSLLLYEEVVRKYLRTGVAVDTGLVILLTIGRYDQNYLKDFKLTSGFTGEDYKLLANFLAKFRSVVLTPHVLSETSNHGFKVPQGRLDAYLDALLSVLQPFHEQQVRKDSVITHDDFRKLGVADTGLIISCLKGPYLLLTTDHKLSGMANRNGVDVLLFDQLRGFNWFQPD